MRQWEIYLFPFGEEKPHPAVIISNAHGEFHFSASAAGELWALLEGKYPQLKLQK